MTELSRPEINIITVEDPVEYRLPGVNQVQVNARGGVTFATALRAILRSDPDVVMVGEIRDGETAKIAIEAALTGHFVLSTLHTNDAPSALTRLNEMGVEPFLTGASVTGVLAQRLARKLCSHCCEPYTPTADELVAARVSPERRGERRDHPLSQAWLPALQPERLPRAHRHLPAPVDDRGSREPRGVEGVTPGDRARGARVAGWCRSGRTGSRRSRRGSRASKSSPALRASAR